MPVHVKMVEHALITTVDTAALLQAVGLGRIVATVGFYLLKLCASR